MKTKRELTGNHKFGGVNKARLAFAPRGVVPGTVSPLPDDVENYSNIEDAPNNYGVEDHRVERLVAVVVETMNFLGMAQHTERFLNLLRDAGISQIEELEELDKKQCETLQLPYELVEAVLERLRVYKLEMQDNAEMALDRGEVHYMKAKVERRIDFSKIVPAAVHDAMVHDMDAGTKSPPVMTMGGDVIKHCRRRPPMAAATPAEYVDQGSAQSTGGSTSDGVAQAGFAQLEQWLGQQFDSVSKKFEQVAKIGDQRSELRAMEKRMNDRFDVLEKRIEARCASQEERDQEHVKGSTSGESKFQGQSLAEGIDKVLQLVDEGVGASKLQGQALEESVNKATEQTRIGISRVTERLGEVISDIKMQTEHVVQKVDDGSRQHKVALDSLEAGVQQKLLQSEDLLKLICSKKTEESAIDAKKAAQRTEAALEAMCEGFRTDLEGLGSRLQTRGESLNAAAKAAMQASQQAATIAVQRAEKTMETFDSSQRTELATSIARITQKIDQSQSSQLRQQQEAEGEVRRRLDELTGQLGKRDEQASRKFEEHLEQLIRHTEQSMEDVGNGMK
eukprot:CAMPEP_0115575066 /NCGR_PEP_ID=MMETSP0272-20121206/1846_1 /TAXON_ID=71861 /ORGANISM="Scrippsiella trochoidea, Strain CCMP3099" /LENGTH=563 /DNA_ID=CAMNT_0003009797 /DNA_START=75 /DNA_END=1764 /DNA_ORIENTATION=+